MNHFGKFVHPLMKLLTHPTVRCGYVLLLALLFVFFLYQMDWSRLAGVGIVPGWLVVAVLSLVAYLFLYAEIWRWLTLWAGVSLPASESYRAWLQSLVGKYIPAKLGVVAQRMVFYNRLWPEKMDVVVGCMAAEWMLSVSAGIMLGLPQSLMSTGAFSNYLFYPGLATTLMLSAIVLAGRSVNCLNTLVTKFFRFPLNILGAIGAYAFGWILNGFCLYAITRTIGIDNVDLKMCLFIYTFAGVAGNIAIFAPVGIGVRDSLLFVGLKEYMNEESAFAAMVLSRALYLTTDFSLSGFAFAYGRLTGRNVPSISDEDR